MVRGRRLKEVHVNPVDVRLDRAQLATIAQDLRCHAGVYTPRANWMTLDASKEAAEAGHPYLDVSFSAEAVESRGEQTGRHSQGRWRLWTVGRSALNVFGAQIKYVLLDSVPGSLFYARDYLQRACP